MSMNKRTVTTMTTMTREDIEDSEVSTDSRTAKIYGSETKLLFTKAATKMES